MYFNTNLVSTLGATNAGRGTGDQQLGLDDLVARIELLQARIRSHKAALRENETRTRMALIDPLMHALGWDVSDPGVVTPEYKVSNGWADYALLRPDGQPAATVEAKKLGEALASHRMQMLTYANASGIDYAGLTDGDHWELYSVFKRVQLEEKRILKVSIANDPAHESALKLLLLWRPNLESGQPVEARAPILGEAQSGEQPPAPPESPGWIALSKYNPPPSTQCPAAIRFWDGSERTLSHWNEILTLTVEKLYTEGLLTVDDAPIQLLGKKTYNVHTEPVHPTGRPFSTHKKINGTPLFVNVKLNAKRAIHHTKKLLQRYGQNPAHVYLQAAQ